MDDNVYFDWELGDEKATDDALGSAAKVIDQCSQNNRWLTKRNMREAAVANMTITPIRYT